MKNTNFENKKRFDVTIETLAVFQAAIENLVTNCDMPRVAAGQLLAAADKLIEVGQDLNALTSCMLDVSEDTETDDCTPHILAWAGWTNDLTSDVLHACDGLIRAIRALLGEREEVPGHG
jgi:hypothetical protein